MNEARIPFTVIGGFLGAGKTTLLQRWLLAAAGRRIAVLVNDFGAINLDAALVAQAGADTIALSNGCVCCSIGDDLSAALLRLLATQPPFDAVVVEASGVSDPWRIAQYALAEPRLALHGVLVLVDAAGLAANLADPLLADTLQRPLAHADLVVLNHADRASSADLAAALAWVAQDAAARHAAAAPVITTQRAALPVHLLFSLLEQPIHHARGGGWLAVGQAPGLAAPPAHDTRFEAWQPQPAGCFDEARLRAWLRALPVGVLRLKGWLLLAGGGWAELQFAGRHGTLRRLPANQPAPASGAAIVAIGLAGQVPVTTLTCGLQHCEVAPLMHAPALARRIGNTIDRSV